jgi:hypothetical protein
MALCRGDVADAAVPVFVIVPLHKPNRPLPRGIKVSKPFSRLRKNPRTTWYSPSFRTLQWPEKLAKERNLRNF